MMPVWDISWNEIGAFLSIVAIDVALAGDNALVVGMAAAGLPAQQRRRAILAGLLVASGLRIVFAIFTVHLLAIVGLTAAGGVLLLWVAWKFYREIRAQAAEAAGHAALAADGQSSLPDGQGKTLRQAILQITLADLSMSLDNVLAVAGAARDHFGVLVMGLGLSVVLMGVAASVIARLIQRHRWIAYLGLLIILYVALSMIWDGAHQIHSKWG